MRGWFDAFREGGGPTLYESERTAASHDNILIAIYTSIGALFLVFLLVIVPAIRHNKIPTAVLMGASLYVLASILLGHFSTSWHVSSSDVLTTYKHSAGLRLPGTIAVNIGLMYFNVTLQMSESNTSDSSHPHNRLFFNERFTWSEVDEVEQQLQTSLQRGYPSPIVNVAETLALDDGTFAWGRSYRIAGYYSDVVLWTALGLWVVSNILFSLVPRFSGYFMLLTGAFLFLCDAIYAQLLPNPSLSIRFEDTLLFFRYGWCFWMILTAGFICVFFGILTIIADIFWPQLISEIPASWRHQYSSSPAVYNPLLYSSPTSPGKMAISSSTCQITVDSMADLGQSHRRPLPRTSTQWTTEATSKANLPITASEAQLEEIDRASNVPPHMHGFTIAPSTDSILSSGYPPPSATSEEPTRVLRDGGGYVNPVMWDINLQERQEDAQAALYSRENSGLHMEALDSRSQQHSLEITRL